LDKKANGPQHRVCLMAGDTVARKCKQVYLYSCRRTNPLDLSATKQTQNVGRKAKHHWVLYLHFIVSDKIKMDFYFLFETQNDDLTSRYVRLCYCDF
jgi:hypothetical protein